MATQVVNLKDLRGAALVSQMQADELAFWTEYCKRLNAPLVQVFLGNRKNWEAALAVGGAWSGSEIATLKNAPMPDASWIPVTDAQGWTHAEQIGPPVCDAPKLPKEPGEPEEGNVAMVWATRRVTYNHGQREVWITADITQDRFPADAITQPMKGDPDGKWHTYVHVLGPFPMNEYLQVS